MESSEWKNNNWHLQGSVPEPLFVIFINELPEQVKSDIFLSGDDTKIFRQMKGSDDYIITYYKKI